MKFSWATKAIQDGKTVNRKADKHTLFIKKGKDADVKRHYKNGTVKEARFTATSVFADDWFEVKA